MSTNRSEFLPPFLALPHWTCPSCGSGSLIPNDHELMIVETGWSTGAREHEDWDPGWIEERFAGLIVCKNHACGQVVSVAGTTKHQEFHSRDEWRYDRYLFPDFLNPAPLIIAMGTECPKEVRQGVVEASSLYWIDSNSCANKLRIVVETILTKKRMRRYKTKANGKRGIINLHYRISEFKEKSPEAADLLLAVKWLGNEGSHSGVEKLSQDVLLDGFVILERVIELIFEKKSKKIKKLARDITARKGRPKR